jgi:hypothetical protein
VILIGIDDTDTLDSKGTNQLARAIAHALANRYACVRIVRHQLLDDPRVPYTSKNGSASIALEPRGEAKVAEVIGTCRQVIREWFVVGSDPGLCVDESVCAETVSAFGRRCQHELVTQRQAREVASKHGIHLEGLGGTEGGVIGALAAVGLAATRDDGRIVQLGEWTDDLCGVQPVPMLHERGIEVRDIVTSACIERGTIDLGKRLRPNVRNGHSVLFVRRGDTQADLYHAVRLP